MFVQSSETSNDDDDELSSPIGSATFNGNNGGAATATVLSLLLPLLSSVLSLADTLHGVDDDVEEEQHELDVVEVYNESGELGDCVRTLLHGGETSEAEEQSSLEA